MFSFEVKAFFVQKLLQYFYRTIKYQIRCHREIFSERYEFMKLLDKIRNCQKKIKLNKDRTQQFSGLFSFSKSNIHVFATNHQVKVGYTQAGYLVWENVKQKEIVKASITLR